MSLDTEFTSRRAPAPRRWLKRGFAALMLSGLAACAAQNDFYPTKAAVERTQCG